MDEWSVEHEGGIVRLYCEDVQEAAFGDDALAEVARLMLVALRAHDPAAHAALIAEQAREAGLRVLSATDADWLALLLGRLGARDTDFMRGWALLRGTQPDSIVTSFAPGENASSSGTVLADYAEREYRRGRTTGLREYAAEGKDCAPDGASGAESERRTVDCTIEFGGELEPPPNLLTADTKVLDDATMAALEDQAATRTFAERCAADVDGLCEAFERASDTAEYAHDESMEGGKLPRRAMTEAGIRAVLAALGIEVRE